jgi:hypothetical protein
MEKILRGMFVTGYFTECCLVILVKLQSNSVRNVKVQI